MVFTSPLDVGSDGSSGGRSTGRDTRRRNRVPGRRILLLAWRVEDHTSTPTSSFDTHFVDRVLNRSQPRVIYSQLTNNLAGHHVSMVITLLLTVYHILFGSGVGYPQDSSTYCVIDCTSSDRRVMTSLPKSTCLV